MSRKHFKTLDQLFAHPISMNIKWSDVVHMFEALGAEVEVVHGGREKIRLGEEEQTFHIPHGKSLDSKDEIMQLRHFLEKAGITPNKKKS